MREIFSTTRSSCAKRIAINFDAMFGTEIAKQLPFTSLYDAYRWTVKMGGIDAAMQHVGFEKVETPCSGDVVICKVKGTYCFGIVNKDVKTATGEFRTTMSLNEHCTFYRNVRHGV